MPPFFLGENMSKLLKLKLRYKANGIGEKGDTVEVDERTARSLVYGQGAKILTEKEIKKEKKVAELKAQIDKVVEEEEIKEENKEVKTKSKKKSKK